MTTRHAFPTITTGIGTTPVNKILATWACKTKRAVAFEFRVSLVGACGLIEAGCRVTGVDAVLAVLPSVAMGTFTCIGINAVSTRTTVQTRAGCAVIVILLAMHTAEAGTALACVGVDVVMAGGIVLAWV